VPDTLAFDATQKERAKFYANMTLMEMVVDILREQPRNLDMIGWGVYQIFGRETSVRDLIDILEELEKRGRAVKYKSVTPGSPSGMWWKQPY